MILEQGGGRGQTGWVTSKAVAEIPFDALRGGGG